MTLLVEEEHFCWMGDVIYKEGDHAKSACFVIKGTLGVYKNEGGEEKLLTKLDKGGVIGEIALIDDGNRSASAMAGEATEVVKVDRDAFRALVRQEPQFALDVMRIMAGRVRQATPEGKQLSSNWTSD